MMQYHEIKQYKESITSRRKRKKFADDAKIIKLIKMSLELYKRELKDDEPLKSVLQKIYNFKKKAIFEKCLFDVDFLWEPDSIYIIELHEPYYNFLNEMFNDLKKSRKSLIGFIENLIDAENLPAYPDKFEKDNYCTFLIDFAEKDFPVK